MLGPALHITLRLHIAIFAIESMYGAPGCRVSPSPGELALQVAASAHLFLHKYGKIQKLTLLASSFLTDICLFELLGLQKI